MNLTANPPSGSQRALILSTPTGDDLPGATEARLRQARLFDHLDGVANQHVVEARALTSDRAAALMIEARRIAPQLLGQLMSDTDVKFCDMAARDVPYQWLPAVVNGPDASVEFEIARSPLPEAPTALRHGPRQVYLEAASCISDIDLTNRAGGEGEVMRDLACDGSGMPACPLGRDA
ncbi:hypothetical protein ACVIGA_005612 [Bradyrhizobium sp. USDA 3240]